MKTIIISAFPGMGKTTLFNQFKDAGLKVADSDSSQFDKADFPANYMRHIKQLIDQEFDVVFISSHQSVRRSIRLISAGVFFVFPAGDRMGEFLVNYIDRGNTKEFVNMMCDNWSHFLLQIKQEQFANFEGCYLKMDEGYLSDFFDIEFIRLLQRERS